jgi:ferritin-like metal-binding protein YciE
MAAYFLEFCCGEFQKTQTNKNPINSFDKEKSTMPIKNPKELFVSILSQVRRGTERSAAIYKELGELAHNPEIQEALEARAFVSEQTLAKLDEAFKLIGEKPMNLTGRLQDVFVEDFRNELGELHSPEARRLFVLAKANHLSHMRTAEYVTLVAASDLSGHHGVGVLLESCLADHLAFVERTKRLIRHVVEAKLAARASG